MTCDRYHLVSIVGTLLALLQCTPAVAQVADAHKLLAEADRLAWLRVWTRAEPLYAKAREAFIASGDERNALYAEVNRLRGQLPTLAVPEVSERLSEYLDNPLVQSDDRLRLRVLIIKGETDEDLDPSLSQRSWTEALALAQKLNEPAWANRARGELGLVAFLQGDTNTAVVNLGQAIKVAETNGDTSSLVRWLTLFGHGFVELGRPEQAFDFYERALKVARAVPELQMAFMTLVGQADALAGVGRLDEAEALVKATLAEAAKEGALGYQAELTVRLASIAAARKQTDQALEQLSRAAEFANAAGGNRILATIGLERGRLLREADRPNDAERAYREGIAASRSMGERLLLPRLLAQLADLQLSRGRRAEASELLQEADDILEGLLTNASSPWVRGRILGSMDAVVSARIRLEGERAGSDPARLFAVLERARARSLVELLHSRPLSDVHRSTDLRAGERRITALQMQLLRTTNRTNRQRLLDEIFRAEEALAPMTTELFARSRTSVRRPVTIRAVQAALRPDEVLYEIALGEPASFGIIVTRATARTVRLSARKAIQAQADVLVSGARGGTDISSAAKALGATLLTGLRELSSHRRLIISAEGTLQQVPFELLEPSSSRRLLETHVVSYTPSASILTMLRTRPASVHTGRGALAVAASPTPNMGTNGASGSLGTNGIYDLNAAQLRPLPLAVEEAEAVRTAFGAGATHVLVRDTATETAVKAQPLGEYRVLHLAAHGIMSTKVPARSAIVLRPSETEDGLLQAREILNLRLNASLVTLSACDTSTGAAQGQDGVASLVRPFVAAGARAVVANLWAADDTFSAAMMREFYRELASGGDIGESLRRAKLRMIETFGPEAVPRLWSGVLVHGDAAAIVIPAGSTAQRGGSK
ncbi:MAG TPA: CHAT domain-containing protein [Vicinamibacterales bacterium]|nr:CHAT domain-containing protein [Vicinamibacterales bacterium]